MSGQIKTQLVNYEGGQKVAPARINTVYIGDVAIPNFQFTTVADAQTYILTQTINASSLWRIIFNKNQHNETVTITTAYLSIMPAEGVLDWVGVVTVDYVTTIAPSISIGTQMNAPGFYNIIFYDTPVIDNGGDFYSQNCTFLAATGSLNSVIGANGYLIAQNSHFVTDTDFNSFNLKMDFYNCDFYGSANLIQAQTCNFYDALIIGDLNVDPGDNGGTYNFYGGSLVGNVSGANVLNIYGMEISSASTISNSTTLFGSDFYKPNSIIVSANNVCEAVNTLETRATKTDHWRPVVTKTFSNFATAALTNTIDLDLIDTGECITGFVINYIAGNSFNGGGIASYEVQIFASDNVTALTAPFSVFSGGGSTTLQTTSLLFVSSIGGGGTQVRIRATSTGANLNAATQGSLNVYIKSSFL